MRVWSLRGQLLEALVELGEALFPPGRSFPPGSGISAAHSEVFYLTADGTSHKMYVTKTRWAELLRDCHGLMVRELPSGGPR